MATKVTKHQIQDLNPSQIAPQGAMEGDALVAIRNPANGGLTLTWSPTSVLPRTALHGQALIYNSYTGTWTPSSINIPGAPGTLPIPSGSDLNRVLTWNGFQWIAARPQGITSLGINTDSSIVVNSDTTNPITSSGTFTISLSNVSLPKLDRGGATLGQVLTWNGTNSWAPSAVTNYVAGIKAWVLFDGTSTTNGNIQILAQKNVETVTDNGVGDYTINFAPNTFSSNIYGFCTGINKNMFGRYTSSVVQISSSATSFRVHTGFASQSDAFIQWDASVVSLAFFD